MRSLQSIRQRRLTPNDIERDKKDHKVAEFVAVVVVVGAAVGAAAADDDDGIAAGVRQ